MVYTSIVDSIGNTPLIKLQRASDETGCLILGKAEFLNPFGSIKDRTAWGIIKDAEDRGLLTKGDTIIEGTAGNTGIALSHIGRARGYKVLIVMPETQTQEKQDAITILGTSLKLVPAVPYANPNNYVKYSKALADEIKHTTGQNTLWANQFDNLANYHIHYSTTAPEIIKDIDGKIDAFTCSAGTGGSISGIGQALKEHNSETRIVISDPFGSALFNYYQNGVLKSEGSSITEGIGQSRITKNLERAPIDSAQRINDDESLKVIYDLMEYEGLLIGISAGLNVAGAIRLAKEMGPGHVIVTLLCDSGTRYQSKIFNPEYLSKNNFIMPSWMKSP